MNSLWRCTGGSDDAVLGVPVYGGKQRIWHKLTIRPLYKLGRRLNSAKWWVLRRFHPRHRHHIIHTGLEPGYYDEDTLILHGCFAMLERYIQWHGGDVDLQKWSEELKKEPDSNAPEGLQSRQAERQMEAVDLYRWWKVERPNDIARRDDLMMQLYGGNRIRFQPTNHPMLSQMEFTPFKPDEKAMEREFRALERKIDDDEQAMLHRLIDIRRSLWT